MRIEIWQSKGILIFESRERGEKKSGREKMTVWGERKGSKSGKHWKREIVWDFLTTALFPDIKQEM